MDHEEITNMEGSELWQKLVHLQKLSMKEPLDPTDIKLYIVHTEQLRAETTSVLPENRLFSLGNDNIACINSGNRIGQQDAKDFFMALDENRHLWSDVFNLF